MLKIKASARSCTGSGLFSTFGFLSHLQIKLSTTVFIVRWGLVTCSDFKIQTRNSKNSVFEFQMERTITVLSDNMRRVETHQGSEAYAASDRV